MVTGSNIRNITNSSTVSNIQDIAISTRELEISKLSHGPGEEEPIGLITEARKRCRTGHETKGTMDADGVLQTSGLSAKDITLMEATPSESDSVATFQTNMAELAMQDSQLK